MDGRTAAVLYGDYGCGEGEFLSRPPSGRPIVITALSDPRMTDRTLHHVTATRYEHPRFFADIIAKGTETAGSSSLPLRFRDHSNR